MARKIMATIIPSGWHIIQNTSVWLRRFNWPKRQRLLSETEIGKGWHISSWIQADPWLIFFVLNNGLIFHRSCEGCDCDHAKECREYNSWRQHHTSLHVWYSNDSWYDSMEFLWQQSATSGSKTLSFYFKLELLLIAWLRLFWIPNAMRNTV